MWIVLLRLIQTISHNNLVITKNLEFIWSRKNKLKIYIMTYELY